MTVKLNGIAITQPSNLEEDVLPIQSDVTALDGSVQRNRLGQKYQAKLSMTQLSVSGYQQIMAILNSGIVSYFNDLTAQPTSPLTFSGLATYTNNAYVNGSSLLQDLDIIIRQT